MQVAAAIEADPVPQLPPGFAELYADHYDFLWRCALRMGVASHDVDDVVQECFVVALRRYPSFDPSASARTSTWLFAILRNVQRNHARSARRRAARLEQVAASTAAAPARGREAESGLAARLLDEFLATLDADKRAAFVLAEIEGMTGPELARALELNLNTANSRVRAARRAFVRHFDGSDAHDLARVQLRRSGRERAPEAARRAGLPAIAALAGAGSTKLGVAVGWLGAKWLAGLIFAAASLGAVAIVASGKPAPQREAGPTIERAAIEARVQAPAEPGVASTSAASQPSPSSDEARASERAQPRERPATRQPTPIERLGKARAALVEDRPERALSLVEDRRFPTELEGRRVAVELAALCRLGRAAEAEARARAWTDEHPDDPAATTLRDVCW